MESISFVEHGVVGVLATLGVGFFIKEYYRLRRENRRLRREVHHALAKHGASETTLHRLDGTDPEID
jgi:hypothetical protein